MDESMSEYEKAAELLMDKLDDTRNQLTTTRENLALAVEALEFYSNGAGAYYDTKAKYALAKIKVNGGCDA